MLAQKVNKKDPEKSKFELALYPQPSYRPVNSSYRSILHLEESVSSIAPRSRFAHFSSHHRTASDLQLPGPVVLVTFPFQMTIIPEISKLPVCFRRIRIRYLQKEALRFKRFDLFLNQFPITFFPGIKKPVELTRRVSIEGSLNYYLTTSFFAPILSSFTTTFTV